jgi:hypothetical protein
MLLMFLAFAYLFVGLAHTISCTDEAVAFAIAADTGTASDDGPDQSGTKKSPLVAEHCYVCAPVLMPALIPDAGPSALSRRHCCSKSTLGSIRRHPNI